MKTRYAPSFQATLDRCGITPFRWRCVAQSSGRTRRYRKAHKTRQWLKKVQQIHTGKHQWIEGRWV